MREREKAEPSFAFINAVAAPASVPPIEIGDASKPPRRKWGQPRTCQLCWRDLGTGCSGEKGLWETRRGYLNRSRSKCHARSLLALVHREKPDNHHVMGARKIAFLNCKGGVGKTSLAVNIAAALAKEEKQRVLLVDMDAQCNASIWLMGIPRWLVLDGMLNRTVCAFFKTKFFLSGAIHKSVLEMGNPTRKVLDRLDLIPAIYDLLDLDHGPEKKGATPYYLEFYRQIDPLTQQYDYIIFDCPPALGRASKCAAFSSPEIYIPAHPDFLSSLGIKLLSERLGEFLREAKPAAQQITPKWRPTKVRGVILNAVPATADTHDAKNNIRTRLKHEQGSTAFSSNALILPIEVRESVAATRLAGKFSTTGVPAVLAASDNPGLADDYIKLAHYIHTHPL